MKEKSKKDNRSLTSLIDELETSINATGDSFNQELIKAIKQRNNENKKLSDKQVMMISKFIREHYLQMYDRWRAHGGGDS